MKIHYGHFNVIKYSSTVKKKKKKKKTEKEDPSYDGEHPVL